jgi:hypothetical protein
MADTYRMLENEHKHVVRTDIATQMLKAAKLIGKPINLVSLPGRPDLVFEHAMAHRCLKSDIGFEVTCVERQPDAYAAIRAAIDAWELDGFHAVHGDVMEYLASWHPYNMGFIDLCGPAFRLTNGKANFIYWEQLQRLAKARKTPLLLYYTFALNCRSKGNHEPAAEALGQSSGTDADAVIRKALAKTVPGAAVVYSTVYKGNVGPMLTLGVAIHYAPDKLKALGVITKVLTEVPSCKRKGGGYRKAAIADREPRDPETEGKIAAVMDGPSVTNAYRRSLVAKFLNVCDRALALPELPTVAGLQQMLNRRSYAYSARVHRLLSSRPELLEDIRRGTLGVTAAFAQVAATAGDAITPAVARLVHIATLMRSDPELSVLGALRCLMLELSCPSADAYILYHAAPSEWHDILTRRGARTEVFKRISRLKVTRGRGRIVPHDPAEAAVLAKYPLPKKAQAYLDSLGKPAVQTVPEDRLTRLESQFSELMAQMSRLCSSK